MTTKHAPVQVVETNIVRGGGAGCTSVVAHTPMQSVASNL